MKVVVLIFCFDLKKMSGKFIWRDKDFKQIKCHLKPLYYKHILLVLKIELIQWIPYYAFDKETFY